MAFDPDTGKTYLFGGYQYNGSWLGDFWEWDGNNWTELTGTMPPARASHEMIYDPNRKGFLLYGGYGGTDLGDTWFWNGAEWTQVAIGSSPPARTSHTLAAHSEQGKILLFGGENASGNLAADTWAWDGSAWAEITTAGTWPEPRNGHVMVYDPARNYVHLYGGWFGNGDIRAENWTLGFVPQ